MSKKTGIIAAVMALVIAGVGVGSYYLDGGDLLGAMRRKARFTRPSPISRTVAPAPRTYDRNKRSRSPKATPAPATEPAPYTSTVSEPEENPFSGYEVTKGKVIDTIARLRNSVHKDGLWDKEYPDCDIQNPVGQEVSFCYLAEHFIVKNYNIPELTKEQSAKKLLADKINRSEAATIFVKGLEYDSYTSATPTYVDVANASWYSTSVETLTHEGVADSLGARFYPNENLTFSSLSYWFVRARMILLAAPVEVVEQGSVSVSLSYPTQSVLKSGAYNQKVLKFEVTVSNNEDVSVNSLRVKCNNSNANKAIKGGTLTVSANGNAGTSTEAPNNWCTSGLELDLDDVYINKGNYKEFTIAYDTVGFNQNYSQDEPYEFILDELEVTFMSSGITKNASGLPIKGGTLSY